MKLSRNDMHDYQKHAVDFIVTNSSAGLFLDMGLGKTVITLTAIDELANDYLEVDKVLVIAPLRVAEDTWATEIEKWKHLKHLKISKVLGTEQQRRTALRAKADIYIINRENVSWLITYYGRGFPFDMVVIDELSSFKSVKAIRFKALRQMRPFIKRVVGLTGTPAPNGLQDLWPQIYLLDMGQRLGKTITGYREKYFKPGKRNGHVVFNYKLLSGSEKKIYDALSDICISMKAGDYLNMPERIDRSIPVRLPEKTQKQYECFEKEQVLSLMSGDISAANAAALTNKLLQFANGAVYNADKQYQSVHDKKLEALEEILDTASGKPVLVFYTYKHDFERICKKLKAYNPRKLEKSQDISDWNGGLIPLLLAHPASAGHGLNLQAGGNIITWFGLTWSLELYQQANARLYRQGQRNTVIIHHLVTQDTMDEDVILALSNKADCQEALLNAVKARIEKYKR